jgi:hypothetical protein
MFIETHNLDDLAFSPTLLTFAKSSNVRVYPCGNRRGLVDPSTPDILSDDYNIPFDPEARLNTEANNRKLSGFNGYTQSYLKAWDQGIEGQEANGEIPAIDPVDGKLTFALAGYLFDIKLEEGYKTPNDFATKLLESSEATNISEILDIYANIRLEETPLFSAESYMTNKTSILRAQIGNPDNLSLDLFIQDGDPTDFNNYYFSGLSFSTKPIANLSSVATYVEDTIVPAADAVNKETQYVYSLKILTKNTIEDVTAWRVNEVARLPKIEHGETPDSVVLGDLESTNIFNNDTIETTDFSAENAEIVNVAVPATGNITRGNEGLLQLDIVGETGGPYQLQFRSTSSTPIVPREPE